MPATSWDGSILPGGAVPTSAKASASDGASQDWVPTQATDVPAPTQQAADQQYFGGSHYAGQQFGSVPQYTPKTQFGTPEQFAAPVQFGTPAQLGTPTHFGTPAQFGRSRAPRLPRDNRMFLRASGGIVIVAALAAAAYVVVPHLTKKTTTAVPNGTVSLPSGMLGYTALSEPQLVQDAGLASWVARSPVPVVDGQVTVYGSGQAPFFTVLAAKLTKHVSPAGQRAYITTMTSKASPGNPFAAATPGPDGGQMACATTKVSATCVSIDDAAEVLVYTYVPETQENAALLTSQVLAAIEH
jgi:hypothetical protein